MPATSKHPNLVFEKKNKNLQKLPRCMFDIPQQWLLNTSSLTASFLPVPTSLISSSCPSDARIHKRPIPHPPVASPYAGSSVPKIVYVSTNTPFMSATKRVQKLLKQAEKRATAKVDLCNSKLSEKERFEQLTKGAEALMTEEVFIKATGRAIDKAMSVGKWFGEKEGYDITVKTGSILVVDDVVEDKELKEKEGQAKASTEQLDQREADTSDKTLPGGPSTVVEDDNCEPATPNPSKTLSKKRKRRDKPADDEIVELPDSRTRWVNVVEIAVRLK